MHTANNVIGSSGLYLGLSWWTRYLELSKTCDSSEFNLTRYPSVNSFPKEDTHRTNNVIGIYNLHTTYSQWGVGFEVRWQCPYIVSQGHRLAHIFQNIGSFAKRAYLVDFFLALDNLKKSSGREAD